MFRSPLFPLFLTVFVDVLGLTIIYPLLPYYAEHFGASPFVVGTLTASYAACQLVSGPVLGQLSDRFGRKRTLLASQLGTLFGFLLIGSATGLPMLFAGRILDGMTAGNLSIAQAYIADVTKPENRTKSFALIGIAFGLGFLIGPAMSGVLAKRFGFAAPALCAAGLSLLSVIFTASLLPDVKAKAGAARRSLSFGRFLKAGLPRRRLLQFFAYMMSFSTLIGGTALFLERAYKFDVEQTGYIFAYSGLIGALVQGGPIGVLAKRLGEDKLIVVGLLATFLGQGMLGFTHSMATLLIAVGVSGFGSAICRPALTTLLTRSVSDGEQGAVLGASQSLSSLSNIVGPMIAGFIIGREWLMLYGIASGSFALIAVLLQLNRPAEPSVEAEAAVS